MRKRWLLILGGLSVLAGAAIVWPAHPTAGASSEPVSNSPPQHRFERVDVSSHAQPGLALTGRVVDVQGRPVPGAQVLLAASSQASLASVSCGDCGQPLLSCPARESALRVQELLRTREGALAAALTATADADGRFRFEHLAGVSFTLWAQALGFGTGVRERAAPGEPAELVLPPSRSLTGRVMDELGRPVPGAVVHAVSRRIALPVEAVADGHGAFNLQGLGEGPFFLLAEKDGWLPGASPQADAGSEPVLVLTAPRTLEVAVTHGGKPVEAKVQLAGDHLARDAVARGGLARFEGLFPDTLVVSAAAGNLAAPPRTLTLEQPVTHVTMEMEQGGRLMVTVVDEAGQPVPKPKLTLATVVSEMVTERVGQTGELMALGPLALGEYVLRASAEGFTATEQPVTVKAGESAIEVVMSRGIVLAGRVFDEYGRPLPGVGVSVMPIQETVYSGEDGRFSIGVPNKGLYILEAHHSDWGGARVEVTAPANNVEVRLEPRAGVVVMVEADGRPVEGASLVLWGGGASFHSDRPSGADGKLVMRGIPPGTYSFAAEHPRFLPSDKAQVTVTEGEPARVTASLHRGASIVGDVVDERGQPLAGVWISGFPDGPPPATSDASGHFELKPLWPDRYYRLEARHPRYELADRAMAQPGGEPLKLVMREKVQVRGRVVEKDGTPVKRFEVDSETVSAPDGRFEVYVSPTVDGNVLVISSPGFEPALVDVPESKDVGDVVLSRSPRLEGMVRDASGAPVPDAVVSCSVCDTQAVTDASGHFSLSRGAGTRSFSVIARKGRLSGTREATDSEGTVEVVVQSLVHLTGRVFLPDGSPAAGQQIEGFEGDRSELVAFVTSADGSYTADVPPGSYRIPVIPGEGDMGVPLLFVRLDGTEQRLDIGPAPGTGSLTVTIEPEPGHALWVVPGTLGSVGDPPVDLMKLPYGQMIYQPQEKTVTVQGLAPGRYTVVWGSHHAPTPGGPLVRTVDVAGPTQLSMLR